MPWSDGGPRDGGVPSENEVVVWVRVIVDHELEIVCAVDGVCDIPRIGGVVLSPLFNSR